jgi:hypothetical protein
VTVTEEDIDNAGVEVGVGVDSLDERDLASACDTADRRDAAELYFPDKGTEEDRFLKGELNAIGELILPCTIGLPAGEPVGTMWTTASTSKAATKKFCSEKRRKSGDR